MGLGALPSVSWCWGVSWGWNGDNGALKVRHCGDTQCRVPTGTTLRRIGTRDCWRDLRKIRTWCENAKAKVFECQLDRSRGGGGKARVPALAVSEPE